MLLCDACETGLHLDCLTPPLIVAPPGDWYCPTCEAEVAARDLERYHDRRRRERSRTVVTLVNQQAQQQQQQAQQQQAQQQAQQAQQQAQQQQLPSSTTATMRTRFTYAPFMTRESDWGVLAREVRAMAEDEMHLRRWHVTNPHPC